VKKNGKNEKRHWGGGVVNVQEEKKEEEMKIRKR
jgi:hypothetical protein